MQKISGNLVDIHNETIYPAEISLENGVIAEIKKTTTTLQQYILPGFIDAHVHIESSMLPPVEFARIAIGHGTVATVSDPHEIANVLGISGIQYMVANGHEAPFKFYFGASSCVPATRFETAGAELAPKEIAELLSNPEIKFLTEVMNYPAVIAKEPEMMEKIAIAKKLGKQIDGHAPLLSGNELREYIDAGITTDHEASSYSEAEEKIRLGMQILIREGSAARNFDDLYPLIERYPDKCMLCTDDLLPGDLLRGHINALVQKAVSKGINVMKVLRCACLNPIRHYRLDVGALKVGDPADFIVVNNLKEFKHRKTYVQGILAAENGQASFPFKDSSLINNFHTSMKSSKDFTVPVQKGKIKVIRAIDGQLLTDKILVEPVVEHGIVVASPSNDTLKLTVINRYKDAPPSVAFIQGFGVKKGAFASSVAHDSHNIIAIGLDDQDITDAVNAVIASKGGIAVAQNGQVELLPLPIAGLMSNKPAKEVASQLKHLEQLLKDSGCKMRSPFMTLSFMALLVIPHLKLSDLGLFDQEGFKLCPLFV